MKLIEKYGKKKVMIGGGITLLLVILSGIGIWYASEQNHKKEVLASIDLVFKNDTFIEYGQEKVDFNEYIQEIKGEPEVTLPDVKIDTLVLGKQELIYKLSKDGYAKEVTTSIEIKDTKAPEITIKEDSIELTEGDDFDLVSNIESVKDPVDGDIEKSDDEKIEKNGYLIKGEVDTATPNEYKVTITAYDNNGNKSEKEYTVTVNKKPAEPQTPTYTNGSGSTGGTTPNGTASSGGNASGNQSNGGYTTPEEPHYRTDISSSYVAQINAYREQNGFSSLPVTGEAQAEANMRAMQLVNNYAHNESSGYTENIGRSDIGYDFFTAWVNSPIHNSTMLDDWYSSFAVSVIEFYGKWYAVTSFKISY